MGFTAAIDVSEAKCAHAGYMERYTKSLAKQAVAEYAAVAKKHGLTPTQLALAWCKVRACHAAIPIQEGSCPDGSPYRGRSLIMPLANAIHLHLWKRVHVAKTQYWGSHFENGA